MSDSSGETPGPESAFRDALRDGDTAALRRHLAADPSLANRDFGSGDPHHSDGYPLVRACRDGRLELVELLVAAGADVNADTGIDEPREFGMPLQRAVERGHYPLAHFLLDRGASVDAYPWCDRPMVDVLHEAACADGAPAELSHRAFADYLPETVPRPELPGDAPASVRLLARVVEMGGRPTLDALVRDGRNALIEELLRVAPERPGTPHDLPHGSVFANVCAAASWHGYPEIMERAMALCPRLHDRDGAVDAIRNALVSHNRDGSPADYRRLIERQLDFLAGRDELQALRDGSELLPHHALAEHCCWPDNYGFRAGVSSPESLREFAELFLRQGFDLNRRDPQTGRTPLAMAVMRGDHPGLPEYAEWLIANGADRCRNDPEETNPLAIAKRRGLAKLVALLEG